jgi:hypothetical protein
MNQNDLKKMLKPLVKQLVKEAMQEELSTVITEIIKQTGGKTVVETKQQPVVDEAMLEERQKQKAKLLNEKRKVLEELSKNSYGGINIFEGTTPLKEGGKANDSYEGVPKSPLSDVDPSDSGVDISGLLRMTGGWKKI